MLMIFFAEKNKNNQNNSEVLEKFPLDSVYCYVHGLRMCTTAH